MCFILPDVDYETLVVFKELVTVGVCSQLGYETLESLIRFTPNLRLEKIASLHSEDHIEDPSTKSIAVNDKTEGAFQNLIENVSFDAPLMGRASKVCDTGTFCALKLALTNAMKMFNFGQMKTGKD